MKAKQAQELTYNKNEYIFRPNKRVFYLQLIAAVLLVFALIGIPIVIAIIIWYKKSYIVVGRSGIECHKGWINKSNKQIPYSKINTIETRISYIDKWLGSGMLSIYTGNDIQGIVFSGIDRPNEIKRLIESRANDQKNLTPKNNIPSNSSSADEIAKFADLKAKGVITEAEFLEKKKQILNS